MTKILVAVDGSARSAGVFKTACGLAHAMKAQGVLYQAIVVPPDYSPAGEEGGVNPLPDYLTRNAKAMLAALVATSTGLSWQVLVEHASQPWRAVLAAATAMDADLIVLGSHGYHGWDHILGTTAGKVANLAHRDVYIVHERTLLMGPEASRASDAPPPKRETT